VTNFFTDKIFCRLFFTPTFFTNKVFDVSDKKIRKLRKLLKIRYSLDKLTNERLVDWKTMIFGKHLFSLLSLHKLGEAGRIINKSRWKSAREPVLGGY